VVLDAIGLASGVGGIAADALEVPIPPGLDEVIAMGDVGLSVIGSISQGETYYGKPHPDLPPMLVLGQDVNVAAGDLIVGSVADAVGGVLGQPTVGGSVVASEVVDWVTSFYSAGYDFGRLFQDIPTEGGTGFYRDDRNRYHIVLLDYQPATNSEETIPLGR